MGGDRGRVEKASFFNYTKNPEINDRPNVKQ